MKCRLLSCLLGLSCLSGPADAAEVFNLDALKREIRELTDAATRAKVRLRHAGAGGAEQARALEDVLGQIQAIGRQIEELDFPIRSAVSKVGRLKRDLEAREREVERVKQTFAANLARLQAREVVFAARKREILSRYPANLDDATEAQQAAYNREADEFNVQYGPFMAEVERIKAEWPPAIERAILNWTALQPEFSEAVTKRDRLVEQGNGLLRQYAAARGRVAAGIAASGRVTPAAPGSVPLVPFAQANLRPEQAGLQPRPPVPVQTDTQALAQLAGAEASGRVAAEAGLGGAEPARWRFDTGEGLAGQVPAVVTPGPMAAESSIHAAAAPIEEPPAAPPPLPPHLAANPKLQALAAARAENQRELAEFRALQREIAQAPDKYDASAMAAVTENLSRAANKDVTLRYMAETAQGGSEVMDLDIPKAGRSRRPGPAAEPPPPK